MGVSISSLLWLWMLTCVTMAAGKMKLVDNGYEGVVIEINPEVPEDEMIPPRLEAILTKASATLFRATGNSLYFREFIVALPESWKQKQHYDNALDVHLEKGHIIIDKANPAYGNKPYTKQYTMCGKSGLYIHLTPEYVLDDDVYLTTGKPEKTMVHEWAHLRWGLFDEYPIDTQDSSFYLIGGKFDPTRCSNEIKGKTQREDLGKSCKFNTETGTVSKNCRFHPEEINKEGASLMFAQYLDNVVEFCDDPKTATDHLKHNSRAPNRQNRLCRSKSAWEVMRDHDDFGKDTKERPGNTNTQPVFKYMRVKPRKRVLVLDTSRSMRGIPLNVMRQATSNYILFSIEDGSQLGIVEFNTNATTICHLQEVKSENDREKLIDCLPKKAQGWTGIGSGLQKGIEVLASSGDSNGGTIILVTDGEETESPTIADVQDVLVKKGIVVHALSFGQIAEIKIASLASDTGGKTFFYSGDPNSTALIDGLSATVEKENSMLPEESVSYSILTGVGHASSDSPFKDNFYIDSTIGRNTSLIFSYTEVIEVTISGPDVVYTVDTHYDSFRYNTASNVLQVLLKSDLSPGKWTYVVATKSTKSSFIVNIQSKARSKGQDIIKVSSWIADEDKDIVFDGKKTLVVYAEVLRGRAPMLNADVLATIERPQASPLDLVLLDNGIGADIIKSDGVYSTNILAKDMTGNGRYNIKVKVAGNETKTGVIIGRVGTNSGASETESNDSKDETLIAMAENFQRVTTAGEFRLQGFANWDLELDVMPPARIADLQLKSFDYKKSIATLTWSSVGDDMERGSASKYIIFTSEDFDDILKNTTSCKEFPSDHIIQGNPETPSMSGEREEFVLRMNSMQSDETVYLSIIAIDDAGNSGEASNVISISPGLKLSIPGVTVDTDAGTEFPTYAIVAVTVTVLLITIIMLGTCLVIRSRKIKSENIHQHSSKQDLSQPCTTSDLGHTDYGFQGEYRRRQEEGPQIVTQWM